MGDRTFNSFVFLDFETTDLKLRAPTEVSLLAVHRNALLSAQASSKLPRITDRLSLCIDPGVEIGPIASELSGIDNLSLVESNKQTFDENVAQSMNHFLLRQERPICLVAHNGNSFDFKILKHTLEHKSLELIPDIFCADSLPAFRFIDKLEDNKNEEQKRMYILKPFQILEKCPQVHLHENYVLGEEKG